MKAFQRVTIAIALSFVILIMPLKIASAAETVTVLTSFLPIYIFTKNVVGERAGVNVEAIIPADSGPHDYQLRPGDMKKISVADAVILNGLGLDDFLKGVLDGAAREIKVLELSAGLPGLIADDEEEEGNEDSHSHGSGFNPHTWVSPNMAKLQVQRIADFMSAADPDGRHEYMKNAEAYITKLERLLIYMEDEGRAIRGKEIITLHTAFDYFARDMGLIIAGTIYHNPDESPSSSQIASLSDLIKEKGIEVIFTEPGMSDRMANVLARETGAKIHILDPIATGEMSADYYEKAIRSNLAELRKALLK